MTARPDHQEIVRDVNDHIREILKGFRAPEGEFFCECDDVSCAERIFIAVSAFDAVRDGQDGRRLLAPKHDGSAL